MSSNGFVPAYGPAAAPYRCRIKICGLTNVADAVCATEAGADLLGFIFYAGSPRAASIEVARECARVARVINPDVACVGVFVNETQETMRQTMMEVRLDAAQLHGDEPADLLSNIGVPAYKAIKRIDAHTPVYIAAKSRIGVDSILPYILLDADHPTLYGGSGARADEGLATQLARQTHLLLAGGLTPDCVANVVRSVRPWGVDVASGTETAPGRKDHGKVRAFVQAVREAQV